MNCKKDSFQKGDFYKCSICQQWLNQENFKWFNDTRYKNGKRRRSYCTSCYRQKHLKYVQDPKNKEQAVKRQSEWRKRHLDSGGDKAIRWYFARQMGTYRKRAQKLNLLCDIDPDFLVDLFNKQNGLCYYSGIPLEWNSWGKKHPTMMSMSVDRKNPSLGYMKENVVLCTYRINTMKGNCDESQFYETCKTILLIKNLISKDIV
jgi:hypothetical protein